jgi:DNA-binding XRE family transcriptional regulator
VSTAEFFSSTTTMVDNAGFVKRARAKLKLTQGELADLLGLERRSILRYERGDPLPPQTRFAIKWLVARHKLNRQRARDRAIKKAPD